MVKHTLHRKLMRDFRGECMQFLAMLLLCALGTWVFAGLDGCWRMQELSIESYLSGQNLADFWVKSVSFTQQEITRIRHLPGVRRLIPRISLEFDVEDASDKVTAMLHAFDRTMEVNSPLIRDGDTLNISDTRGCLVEEQFARAQGWHVGDTVNVSRDGISHSFVIRGLVLSPEYLITTRDMAPDPSIYGFILLSSKAFPDLPFNDLIIDADDHFPLQSLEEEIEKIVPAALILTQSTHGSTAQGRNYIQLFQKMSYLFPVLAYFVAALIVVTTISRMLESQRIQIGTLKALGYTDRQIRRHYLNYALYPSLLGSALGLFIAQFTLPQIIWLMVATNIRVPQVLRAPVSPFAWFMSILEVVLSVLICLWKLHRSMRETTAELLRPKPPKAGSRILLEKWKALWKRLSFNSKMMIRNIIRAKGRTFLSMIGMLFCNMLIICSFGLQESIPYFVNAFFFNTLRYEVRADLDSSLAGSLDSYRKRLDAAMVDGCMEMSIRLRSSGYSRTCLLSILPEDISLICLGEDQSATVLPEDGILLMEKLADVLHAKVGDELEMWLPGYDEPVSMVFAGVAYSNIGQTAYMGEKAWKKLRKGGFRPNVLLLQGVKEKGWVQLEEMDEVTSLKYPDSQFAQTMRIMDSASAAFSVLSGVALGLAFVICYNMGLLNFTERTREYATLKVLGYHQREIRGLMLRENNLVAIFGVFAGVWPGIILVSIILKMCEFDSMIFVPHISWWTIVCSSAVTFAFTCFIEWLLTRKVRGIDMVEALKSVE